MALEYRILKNGNGKYKIQTKGTLWGWNDVKEYISHYDGGEWYTKYFDSYDVACTWYLTRCLDIQHYQDKLTKAKQWEVDNRKCSSILISKEQNG